MAPEVSKPMSRRTKIILSIVGGSILLCLITCGIAYVGFRQLVTQALADSPEEAASIAHQITDYNLPPGYSEQGGTSTLGILNVMIADEEAKNTIWLVQSPNGAAMSPETFLRQAIAYQANNPIEWNSVDVKVVSIRGQKTSITVYEGSTQDAQKYHAWAGAFQGKNGPALIIIVGPAETWDAQLPEAFISSMR